MGLEPIQLKFQVIKTRFLLRATKHPIIARALQHEILDGTQQKEILCDIERLR